MTSSNLGGQSYNVDVLSQAKRIVNMPNLIGELCPNANLRGLTEDGTRGSTMYDPRPGREEATPSFTVGRAPDGTWVYNRHDGDTPGGTSVDLLMSCKDLSVQAAITELISRANLTPEPRPSRHEAKKPSKHPALAALQKQQSRARTPDLEARLKGWEKLDAETPEDSPERQSLESRGLWGEVLSDKLRAYRYTGRRSRNHIILPGAVAFVIRGPDEKATALKVRNPGTKGELEELGKSRYCYEGKGGGAPAYCCARLEGATAEIWVEGELNAIAIDLALRSAGINGTAVQGVAGVGNMPWLTHDLRGQRVYVIADGDKDGDQARLKWEAYAQAAGAVAYQLHLSEFVDRADACDVLPVMGAAALGAALNAAINAAQPATVDVGEAIESGPKPRHGNTYVVQDGVICRVSVDRSGAEIVEPLASFVARITVDAAKMADDVVEHLYTIEGTDASGTPMRPIIVTAAEYDQMSWVPRWGSNAYVSAGRGMKDHLRVAIMQLSNAAGIAREMVYTRTGWVDGMFLHGGISGAITTAGPLQGARVELQRNLASYELPEPPDDETARRAIRASLALLELAPAQITVPMLGATYRAPLGRARYVLWVAGMTGSGKTAMAILCLCHYGATWNDANLPASFNSTGFSMTVSAFSAADVLFLADDYKPAGHAAAMAKAHAEVGRLISAVGEGAGRLRGSTDGTVHGGEYPRGVVMITGEMSLARVSDVARTVTVEVHEPLITASTAPAFGRAQQLARDGVYAQAMSAYIAWIAPRRAALYGHAFLTTIRDPLRPHFAGQHAHNRTPDNTADLAGAWRVFLTFALESGAINEGEAQRYWTLVRHALSSVSADQASHLTDSDPVRLALRIIQSLFLTGRAYVADAVTGEAPDRATEYGWRRQGEGDEVYPATRAMLVGYLKVIDGVSWLMFLPDALYVEIQRLAVAEEVPLPGARTLWRRLKEALRPLGFLSSEGDRTTYRRSVFGTGDQGARVELLHLRSDYMDYLRQTGTDSEERVSERDSTFVPISFFSPVQKEVVGTGVSETAAAPHFASVPKFEATVPAPVNDVDLREGGRATVIL